MRDDGLTGQAKLARRQTLSKPAFERFFAWIDERFDKRGFLPSSPFLGALAYIREPASACRSASMIQPYRSTRTISSARCG